MGVAPPLFETAQHRYGFERELGAGGMATVHLARDVESGASVAIKLLRRELVPILGAERFAREIRITSRLAHPNILPVLDYGEVDGLPFYVTPYVAGESLAQRLRRIHSSRSPPPSRSPARSPMPSRSPTQRDSSTATSSPETFSLPVTARSWRISDWPAPSMW